MHLIRKLLGSLILTLNSLFPPKKGQRSTEKQAEVDKQTAGMILYHFEACPFCVKVRRKIQELGLNIETRDVRTNPQFEKELMEGGKEYQVPCLKIPADNERAGSPVRWMYESSDINQYLEQRFPLT
jgi:glutaredoxin